MSRRKWKPSQFWLLCTALVIAASIGACKSSTNTSTTPQEDPAAPSDIEQQGDENPMSIPAPPDVAKIPDDAERTASGIGTRVLSPGKGEKPEAQDTVSVHYTGWTTDGEMFDSSVVRGSPAQFPLNRVIPGWTEGLQLMQVGEKRRLWIPEELAYRGQPGAPAGMLVFDVELLGIEAGPKPIPAPDDVAAAPADAVSSSTGLKSKVLEKGSGSKKPALTDRVSVHYTGWTTDGKMFDSSKVRGKPVEFPLDGVIEGWSEGVQLMVVGEKRRFWIPEELAYKGRPGAPAGTLVFDVELLDVKEVVIPKVPEDVAKPPADAQKTKSGLASKVLKKGTGKKHPEPTSRVKVHYSGWTVDGKMFDSSVARGEPIVFPLNAVIPGWTEGVGLMVEGETRRLWIPEDLAYKGMQGAPAGMLVFDVELIEIED